MNEETGPWAGWMKRVLLLSATLLAMTASLASAAPGVNLRWDACHGDGGAINRNFACNTNAGTNSMRASFELGSAVPGVSGIEASVHIVTDPPVLPEWWEFRNAGACRVLALSIQAYDGTGCFDWAMGQASMNIAGYDVGFLAPNRARVRIVNAVVPDAIQGLSAGVEYTVFALNINNLRTVGATCTGCQVPAGIVFNSLGVASIDGNIYWIAGPTNGTDSHFIAWQGWLPTPTRRATWRGVKSLFR